MIEAQTLTGNIEANELTGTLDKVIEIIEPNLQEKEITPTKQTQVVQPDEEYNGLSQVTVNPIPNEYIIPALDSKSITANGQYYASDDNLDGYSLLNVNVPSGGATIHGTLQNKIIQSGNILKGDFVKSGSTIIDTNITSNLRYYITSAESIDYINNVYTTNENTFMRVNLSTGSAVSINIGLPTREQMQLPEGKNIINFTITCKADWTYANFAQGETKTAYLYRFSNENVSSGYSFGSKVYSNDDPSTFPKLLT